MSVTHWVGNHLQPLWKGIRDGCKWLPGMRVWWEMHWPASNTRNSSFFFVFNSFPEGHTVLIYSPGKTHLKVMILLCIKKLFCVIYYLFTEALRALEFHPCMKKRYNPVPRNLLAETFAITKLASVLLNRFLNWFKWCKSFHRQCKLSLDVTYRNLVSMITDCNQVKWSETLKFKMFIMWVVYLGCISELQTKHFKRNISLENQFRKK